MSEIKLKSNRNQDTVSPLCGGQGPFLPWGEVPVTGWGRGWRSSGVWLCLECGGGVAWVPWDSSAFCMATHSSPGGRPALEAQRKPRLSEAESGVLPILPPEKGRENRHLLRKGPGPHPALLLQLPSPGPAPGPSVVWGVWGLGLKVFSLYCGGLHTQN